MKTHSTLSPVLLFHNRNRQTFEQGFVALLTRDQLFMPDITAGLFFNVEEAMKKWVLKTLTPPDNGFEIRLSAALKSLIKRAGKREVISPQTSIIVTEAVIDNPGSIAPTTTLVKSGKRKSVDKRVKN